MNNAAFSVLIFVLFSTSLAQADELGRLFFTPDERQQLDQQYDRHALDGSSASAQIVNGLIQRSDGKRTVWINGKPEYKAAEKKEVLDIPKKREWQ